MRGFHWLYRLVKMSLTLDVPDLGAHVQDPLL